MPSMLNDYLTRENDKKNLKKLFEDKQLSFEEARFYVKKLNLTEEEFNEIFEGLGAKLKAGWKTLTGRGDEGRTEYAQALKAKQDAAYGKIGGAGDVAKATLGAAAGGVKTFLGGAKAAIINKKLDAQIAAKKGALENTPQGPARQAIEKQIADLQAKKQTAPEKSVSFDERLTQVGKAAAAKVTAGQGAVDTKVAKLLSKNVVNAADKVISKFNTSISGAADKNALDTATANLFTELATAIKGVYAAAGVEAPRGVL